MNKFKFETGIYALMALTATLFVSCQKNETPCGAINSYPELKSFWADPPAGYRSAPLWDWNDSISEEGIDFQMEEFKKAGIGGVFVHPRPGLITDYLSDEWSQLFDFTVKKGKELGMNVWIYDENSYPSGFAGGHVPAEMPDSYQNGTGLLCEVQEELKVDETETFEVILKQAGEGFEDISDSYRGMNGQKGRFYLFKKACPRKSPWYGGFSYVDLLYPGVTEKFLEITMRAYEKYNKPDFGGTVKGIFTDEPNLEAAMPRGAVIRWTPDLWGSFEKRWGYDLKKRLPSLVYEVGDWKKTRHDYYELLLELFVDRWAKPCYAYCEENNLDFTGHYWEHGWPEPTDGLDEAAFYIWHQQPAVDMLGCKFIQDGLGGQFGNTRAIRELRSAANQAGRIRTLSETYGGGGYEMDFKKYKQLADWQCVLGVNFVNQHLSYFNMEGVRKFDYPPTFSYQEPWWEDYRIMGDYLARISMATATGEQINETLVLQPNTSAWMYFSRVEKNPLIDSIRHDFKYFVYQLEKKHFEYDLGSEKVLRDLGSVSNGKLIVGKRAYKLLVIPHEMENIDLNTCEMLEEFLSQGGKVLSFRKEIERVDGEINPKVSRLKAKYPKQWKTVGTIEDKVVFELMKTQKFSITDLAENKELFHQRRILSDGQLLFVVNSSETETAEAKIAAEGKSLIKLDLFFDVQNIVPSEKTENGIAFETKLFPLESALYFISNKKEKAPGLKALPEKMTKVEMLGDMETKRLSDNILTIDYLDIRTEKTEKRDIHFMKALVGLFEENGIDFGNPWQHKIQYRQNYVAMDTLFKEGSGFEVDYHFNVSDNAADELIAGLKAVVEHPELWSVSVNGNLVVPEKGKFWVDRHFPVFKIGNLVKKGKNTIRLKAPRMSVFAEVMPVYILGDFSLSPLVAGFEIEGTKPIGTKNWVDAGLPYYSQKVSYAQKFNGQKGGDYIVSLPKWKGTVCDVLVNGKKAGIIAFPPYQLDISDLVKTGENTVEVQVTGSLKNTFGYFYRHNDKLIHGPHDWNYAPEGQQALGGMYLEYYGLLGPFEVSLFPHNYN